MCASWKNEPSSASRRSARSTRSETLPDAAALRLTTAQRAGVIFLGALLLLLIALLFAQLLVLQDSNDRIHAQDAKIADLRADAKPLLEAVRPLVEETRPLIREARQLTTPFGRTAEDLSLAAEEAPQVARAVRAVIGRSLPLVDALGAFIPEARDLIPRLRLLMPRVESAIGAMLHVESLQTRQLHTTRRQLAIQLETLAIQKEALVHIRNIDRRTGGGLQPPG